MNNYKRETLEERQEKYKNIKKLWNAGWTKAEIAKEVGMTPGGVRTALLHIIPDEEEPQPKEYVKKQQPKAYTVDVKGKRYLDITEFVLQENTD